MKRLFILTILSLFVMASCHQKSTESGYCTVKGTVKGLKDGTKLQSLKLKLFALGGLIDELKRENERLKQRIKNLEEGKDEKI